MSDWVVVSLHCHELGGEKLMTARRFVATSTSWPDFAVDFAHRCIDAGADIFVGHGPQEPFGVELYNNRPIFYSLGSTISELETPPVPCGGGIRSLRIGAWKRGRPISPRFVIKTIRWVTLPDPAYWKQVVARCEFENKKVSPDRSLPTGSGLWEAALATRATRDVGR